MAFDNNNVPYVVYADGTMIPFVSKFENDAWVTVGGGQVGENTSYYYLNISINNNNEIFITYNNYNTRAIDVFKLNGESWEMIGDGMSEGAATYMDMDIKNENPVIAYVDMSNGNHLTIKGYQDGEWTSVGQTACSEGAIGYPQISINDGTVYVAYTEEDMNGEISMMRYVLTTILYPPTNFSGVLFDGDCVELNWNLPLEGTPISYNVYRDNLLIANVVDMTYYDNNLPIGTYRYTLTTVYAEGESVAAGPVTIETTIGVDENELNTQFTCYPTFVKDNVRIESKDGGIIRVINVNGLVIKEVSIEARKTIIDFEGCGSGMYLLEMNGIVKRVVRN